MQSPWYISAAAWILVVACCPCFVCFSLAVPHSQRHGNTSCRDRQKREVQKQAKANKVKPLGRRKRELSADPKNRRKDQIGCPLLTRLPLEIRFMIWELVLGGNNYHLVQASGRIAHVRCQARLSDPGRSCCTPAVAYWKTYASRLWDGAHQRSELTPQSLQKALSNGDMAITRTCRQIYEEAINLPYTSNTFDIDDPRTLSYFAQTIRPQRLSKIKHLRCHFENHSSSRWGSQYDLFCYASPPGTINIDIDGIWPSFCKLLKEDMASLEDLEIVVQQDDSSPYSLFPRLSGVAPWCICLRKMSGLKTFEMTLRPWAGQAEETSEVFDALVKRLRESILLPRKVEMSRS